MKALLKLDRTRKGASAALAVLAALSLVGCTQYATVQAITPYPSTTSTAPGQGAVLSALGDGSLDPDWLLLSMEEDGHAHLFHFGLHSATLTRLTIGESNDITPSISPDGNLIAFASDRGGFWDLYSLDLHSGHLTQLTDTHEYDATPVWSPDMAWLAYETYRDGQLDIAILSLTEDAAAPVLLTENPASDHSPAWSADGRRIAFVSDRTGDADIWVANLDDTAQRFQNVSQTPDATESHPTWTLDGSRLAWASKGQSPRQSGIYTMEAGGPDSFAAWAGSGSWPAWDRSAERLAVVIEGPNQQALSTYLLTGTPLLLPVALRGTVRGLAWPTTALPAPLPDALLGASLGTVDGPSPAPVLESPEEITGRWEIASLEDTQLPEAGLHALVKPSFIALRERVLEETGWDPLASLQQAFVPLTTPLDPGLEESWLYTGRAFSINSLMLDAGWMAVVREDLGNQTYWRVYVRARNQDGSQGLPMKTPPWGLNTRFNLEPKAYDAGGRYAPVPPGYWIDLTSLAELYGWHRLPALPNWRAYYSGARFSEFAHTDSLDWYSAMLELYPPVALVTPTPVLPPTITPSRTPRPTTTPYPTWTPPATRTPSNTPTPSKTSTFTATSIPTSTPPTIIPTFASATP